MSDSELSTPADIPDNAEIEQVLHQVVREALAKNEDITVNLARSRAESQLGLDAGFLKDVGDWKQKSKEIINAAVEGSPSPAKRAKTAPKSQPSKVGNGKKRKSGSTPATAKRQRKTVKSESDEEEEVSNVSENEMPTEAANDIAESKIESGTKVISDGSDLSEPPVDEDEPDMQQDDGQRNEDDDSDVSLVIDDAPPKKRQRKASTSEAKAKSKASTKAKAMPKAKAATKELSPDEEEIKRLQGWLLKCGVRKLWHRELAPYDTSKGKIQHLKKMLTDIGMTGRFSVDKAKQIKERRELAAELEAAQSFNQQWGHSDSEDMEGGKDGSRPRRAAPKGLIDFGDSGDDSD